MATITTLGAADSGATSRTVINDNFSNLNAALPVGTVVTEAGSQTLTNKTVALGSNTISGTTAEFNTALSDNNFATLAGSEALTNKTLTSSTNTLGGVTMGLGSDADADLYYRSSGVLTRLPKGTGLQGLRMNAGATAPEWATTSGGDLSVFAPAGAGTVEVATFALDDSGSIPVASFADGTDNAFWRVSVRVPTGATSISSIVYTYKNRAASSLNIYADADVFYYPPTNGGTVVSDTDMALQTFASPATVNQVGLITLPSSAYNAIGTVAAGGVVVVSFRRQGNDASDTYGQALYVLGMTVTFA